MIFVAVDIGGTFTDLIGFDSEAGRFLQAKSLTTPANLVQGIIDCIGKSGVAVDRIDELIHGSTIAINTLIERKGAKTGLIVTRGTRDVYIIGRGNRPESYNLFFHRHQPLVPRRLTREVGERVMSSGEVRAPLSRKSVEQACAALRADGVEAIAVCFLHSYLNPEHERAAGEIVRRAMPDVYLSLSHQILREYREFERMSTTVVNAYIGPTVGGYVRRLKTSLGKIGFAGELSIMRSNGGVMTPEVATERPVAMMESGPVGGIIASAQVGQAQGFPNVISFDMGGTTAKTSLIRDGETTMAPGYYVGGYASGHPVMLPMIDVVEVGAGGGSIAWIDDVGALKVGPQSAGADPGPICYRGGGSEPTITDANVVLGRLDPDNFLGGQMKLDAHAAARGIKERIARPLGVDAVTAAQAIVEIAIAKMSLAVREVSVAKGYDPRDFALVASGGAGPLHVMAIARELFIPTVIVPLFPSHFSALGMLLADERHDFIRTFYCDLAGLDFAELRLAHGEMVADAQAHLRHAEGADYQIHLDLRYVGQEFTLSVPVALEQIEAGDGRAIRTAFDRLYEHRYAHHSPEEPVEMVNIRLAAVGKRAKLKFPTAAKTTAATPASRREAYFASAKEPVVCPVYGRDDLGAGASLVGPALIQEHGTTTVLFLNDRCTVADSGELIITVASA
ncbi:MAG: hydantoinase/oxoprolinase family protein [Xanthobacteraceae bacterium]